MRAIEDYSTIIFDCDGVILNSNKIKSEAFFKAAEPYGKAEATQLVAYHVQNGGISRYKKFEFFCKNIISTENPEATAQRLIKSYAAIVKERLMTCELSQGITKLREKTMNSNWLVVSGSDQIELREVLTNRKIEHIFNGGIFGSPDTKHEILAREIDKKNIRFPALFLGDSFYDFQAASDNGLDFIFISDWTEVPDWKTWTKQKKIANVKNINSLATS